MAFLSNFTSGWPQLTLARCLTHRCITLWSGVLSTIFWWPQGISKEFNLWLTLAWPVHDFWPQQCITLWSWVLPTKFGGHRALLRKLTPLLDPSWPFMTFDPVNVLRSGHGFFPPNLVAIGHYYANWPLLDPSWPFYDLWPQQYIMLWLGIFPTKFGGHRTFLSNLTPGRPQMTPAWPLIPSNALHFGQGFFPPNLVAIGHC